jgi:hypothetical protein
MFACLDRALTLEPVRTHTAWKDLVLIHTQAITRFTQVVDNSEDVPPLRKKTYCLFLLSRGEWKQLKLLHELMKVGYAAIFCALYKRLALSANLLVTGACDSSTVVF